MHMHACTQNAHNSLSPAHARNLLQEKHFDALLSTILSLARNEHALVLLCFTVRDLQEQKFLNSLATHFEIHKASV